MIDPQRKRIKTRFVVFSAVLMIAFLLAACASETPIPIQSVTPSDIPIQPTSLITPTRRPTVTPTLPPLGTEGNPIIIGFLLSPENREAIEACEDLAFLIESITGYQMEYAIFPDFQSLAVAALNGDVHLYWLAPFEYLYLHGENAASVVIVTNHLGVYAYGVQFLANFSRGFTAYFDPDANQSVGEMIQALQQFSGTRPCFLNSNSIPGYYVPLGLLANTSTPILDPVFTYSYNAVIRALYIQGICDFGVSYALTGDPRTASDILQNIPDAQNQVIIIWQSEGIIPNLNLSSSPDLPLNIRYRLQEAFLDLPNQPEGLSLLSTALVYNVEGLKQVQDAFYNPLRSAIAPLELNLETITTQSKNP